jgi:hypothetical protein
MIALSVIFRPIAASNERNSARLSRLLEMLQIVMVVTNGPCRVGQSHGRNAIGGWTEGIPPTPTVPRMNRALRA